jgi:ribonuclease HII
MLHRRFQKILTEAGVDEAGRGCLAGPVFAAAVILPQNFSDERLNDSKKLTEKQRNILRSVIESEALAWAVASADNQEIDQINILKASFLAMHRAIEALKVKPGLLLIDGNRFNPYNGIQHQCIVKGDSLYQSIAAASILAKTHRDEYMLKIAEIYPEYFWHQNKGYPTVAHRQAVLKHGFSLYHRRSFSIQQKLF